MTNIILWNSILKMKEQSMSNLHILADKNWLVTGTVHTLSGKCMYILSEYDDKNAPSVKPPTLIVNKTELKNKFYEYAKRDDTWYR